MYAVYVLEDTYRDLLGELGGRNWAFHATLLCISRRVIGSTLERARNGRGRPLSERHAGEDPAA